MTKITCVLQLLYMPILIGKYIIIILITCEGLNVLFIDRARHIYLVFPGNCIADTRVTSGDRQPLSCAFCGGRVAASDCNNCIEPHTIIRYVSLYL